LQAAKEMNLAPEQSVVVGDRWSDIKTAANCGARSVLVRTGYGRGDELYIGPHQEIQPDYKAEDLREAVEWILQS
ncbi:MAG: HAD hydrolase-like protein, partial [Proteobacteria bacterium]|nr:HAD hydrolase-like protein [Pseudomonadota bacterium]